MNSAVLATPAVARAGSRPAWWWAGVALLCSLVALGVGAASGVEVGLGLRAAAFGLVCWAAAEDLRTRRLRNVLTAPALVLAFAGNASPVAALLGTVLAPLPFLLIAIPRPRAMGMGDVKLAAVAGAWAGVGALPLWWLATALAGAALALLALIRGGPRSTLAYGPALVAGLGPLLW